jgi:nicotinate-nucleotide adenylyltransferase
MKVGIFGGTFDPPHIGHLILAEEAVVQLALEQVLWVLTPLPPHKRDIKISPVQDRMSMVLLAIAGNAKFSLSRVDMDRPAPHFATDTMALLHKKSPKDELVYLMGADSLVDLNTWHEPARFVSLCHQIGVMKRYGEIYDVESLGKEFPGIERKLLFIDTPLIGISGSDIRKRVSKGKNFRYFVPDKIYHFIINHKLYQA